MHRILFFQELAPMFDLLLFDVKQYDSLKHKEGTGVGNEQIIKNLRWAIQKELDVLPRILSFQILTPHWKMLPESPLFLKEVGASKVQLLPFHQFGENKYHLLGKTYEYEHVEGTPPRRLRRLSKDFLRCRP